MNDRAVTLKPEDAMGERVTATAPRESILPRGGSMKFTYPTGSHPLEGYTIKRGIGAGGFGEVYYATSDAGKEVALKHIQRNLDIELRGVSQCLNLKHPDLVTLFDIRYDDEGEAWVVMEYVAGESLKDVIEQNPDGMPLDEVRFWLSGIAAGVAYLHDHGIVHRDLKPGNIFLDEEVVKIGDYGLSKFISCSRRSGHTESVGTFHYMAPEIGRGNYGKEIDIYALGVILYEMLTGRVPFDGESTQEIIMKHLTDQPDLSVLPAAYAPAIGRALEKDPAKRFQNVAQFMAALKMNGTPAGAIVAAGVGTVTDAIAQGGEVYHEEVSCVVDEEFYIGDEGEGIEFGPLNEVVNASVVREPEEPIARFVHRGWRSARHSWQAAGFHPLTKLFLLGVGILVLITQAGWVLPFVMIGGVFYASYLLVRLVVQTFQGGEPKAAPVPQASTRRISLTQLRAALAERPRRQRATELVGSLVASSLVCLVMSVVTLVAGGRDMSDYYIYWAPLLAWLTLVGTAGSWAVLTLGKSWERRKGEQIPRRFGMLVVGLMIGLFAWWLAGGLHVDFSYDEAFRPLFGAGFGENMFDAYGHPLASAYLAYFGGLFVVLRWWRLSDPLRSTRVSLWATLACGMWGWLLHLCWPFLHPWGLMLAVTIALAVQMSSPWIGPADRARLREELREAEAS